MNRSEQLVILLEGLLEDINHTICIGDPGAVRIGSISADSRDVISGSLFIALEGETVDGHDYIGSAVENGAAAVMISKKKAISSLAYDQKNVVFI
jgi:UDP-N-acetylmuramyl pentapeptide synthase